MIELNFKESIFYHKIKSQLTKNDFPWFFEKYGNEEVTNFNFLSHVIIKRNDTKIYSSMYNDVYDLLTEISNNYKFRINRVFRMAFNLTYPCGLEKSGIHTDHEFEHKNMIIYFNNSVEKIGTIIYKDKINKNVKNTFLKDKKMKVLKETTGEEGTGIVFDGKYYHESSLPKKNKRIILVTTFI